VFYWYWCPKDKLLSFTFSFLLMLKPYGLGWKIQIPKPKFQIPRSKYQGPNTKFQIPSSKYQNTIIQSLNILNPLWNLVVLVP
jgi:hypothetical protein